MAARGGRRLAPFLLGALLLTATAGPLRAGPVVRVEPTATIVDPGDLFEIAIRIDAGVDTMSNFQIFLTFDTDVIEFVTALEGSLYTETGHQTWFYFAEVVPGSLEVFDVIFPALSFILPPGELARVRFHAVADGFSDIRIAQANLKDILRNPVSDVSVLHGYVCVGDAATDVEGGEAIRLGWGLGPPTPNPTRGPTVLRLTRPIRAPGSEGGRLSVYDAAGRLVRNLAAARSPGISLVEWDGTTDRGAPLPSGVYFVRLETSAGALTRSVVLLR